MGRYNSKDQFVADDVLAKHDEKYMPSEVAAALQTAEKTSKNKATKQQNNKLGLFKVFISYMKNKSYAMILLGLVLIIIISILIYFGMSSTFLHVLLAISFFIIGAGIFLGFIKMISDDKNSKDK